MKHQFIWNISKKTLINVQHITAIGISSPQYEQKDYRVVCSVASSGSQVLFKGSEEECENFLTDFYMKLWRESE